MRKILLMAVSAAILVAGSFTTLRALDLVSVYSRFSPALLKIPFSVPAVIEDECDLGREIGDYCPGTKSSRLAGLGIFGYGCETVPGKKLFLVCADGLYVVKPADNASWCDPDKYDFCCATEPDWECHGQLH